MLYIIFDFVLCHADSEAPDKDLCLPQIQTCGVYSSNDIDSVSFLSSVAMKGN